MYITPETGSAGNKRRNQNTTLGLNNRVLDSLQMESSRIIYPSSDLSFQQEQKIGISGVRRPRYTRTLGGQLQSPRDLSSLAFKLAFFL